MKLQNSTGKTEVIDFGGNIVKFIGGLAEVDDKVGEYILGEGYAGVREHGKVVEVTAESVVEQVQNPEIIKLMQENARLESLNSSLNEEIAKLTNEVKVWKSEVEKLKLGESSDEPTEKVDGDISAVEEKIRSMKKDDLISYCKELGLPSEGNKDKLIEILLEALKQ